MVSVTDVWRPRRRKCRRPKFATEAAALWYAREQLGQHGRRAYQCTAHEPPRWHLTPLALTSE